MTGCGHCSSPQSYSYNPYLVYTHGKNFKKKTFQSLQPPTRSSPCKSPQLRGRTITTTFPGGWFLLNDIERNENFLLWNHSTFESIHLPPLKLDEGQQIQRYVMWRDDDGVFTLLVFESETPCIFMYRSGSGGVKMWKTIPYYKAMKDYYKQQNANRDYSLHLVDPVWCNSKLYALTHSAGRLVEIEIKLDDDDDGRKYDGRVVIKSLECETPKFRDRALGYTFVLIESGGDMLMIYIPLGGVKMMEFVGFHVYRLDQLNLKWEKLESLPGQDLFLEISWRISGFRCNGGGNRIYYTRDEHKYLYCYDMEDNSLFVSLPCPNLTTPWISPTWVMPIRDDDTKISTQTEERDDNNEFSDTLSSASAAGTPWFVMPGRKGTWTFSDPNIIDVRYVITVPESLKKKDVRIECSKNGWLLLSCYCYESQDFDTAIVFYNPFTKATIHLPDLDNSSRYAGFAFSSSPISEHCTVVAIEMASVIRISRWRWGQTDWETFVFQNNEHFSENFNNPVFWKGSVFFLDENGKLGVFDRNNRWRAFNKPKKPCGPLWHNFLVYCRGELVSVFIGFMGRSVNVFKLNQLKLAWEKVESLGDYALFYGRPSSFAAKAVGMENRIYVPRFYGDRQVYYSLKTNKFHFVGSDEILLDYCGTKEHLECGWIQPPQSYS